MTGHRATHGWRLRAARLVLTAVAALLSSATEAVGRGSHLVRDINDAPRVISSDPRGFQAVGTHTVFFATDPVHGRELWRTDGTEAGTVLIKDLYPGPSSPDVTSCMVEVDGALVFTAETFKQDIQLWRTDGTPEGTILLREIPGSLDPSDDPIRFCQLAATGDNAFFLAFELVEDEPTPYRATLWRTDGRREGTVAVRTFEDLFETFDSSMAASNGLVFFRADRSGEGMEPWRSDGTEAGTFPLADIATGFDSSFPYYFAASHDGACFTAQASSEPSAAVHLWCSDGTRTGTRQVIEVEYYQRSSATLDGRFFFEASIAGANGIWGTDGTPEGTRLVMSGVTEFGVHGAWLYLFKWGPVSQLLRSDGTMEGTTPVAEFGGSAGGRALVDDDGLTFGVSTPSGEHQVWTSDLTSAGTVMRGDLGDTSIAGAYNGTLYLFGVDPQRGSEPWIFDPITRMPALLKNIGADDVVTPGSVPLGLTEAAGMLYFFARGPDDQRTLWRSDGTGVGTVPVFDVEPRALGGLTPLAGDLYFYGERAANVDRGLWRRDGAAGGTEQIWAHPTRPGGSLRSLLVAGDRLFFTYDLEFYEAYLCASDGGMAGTTCGAKFRDIGTLAAVGEAVFFVGEDRDGRGLWKTDGTHAGTSLVRRAAIASLTGSDTLAYFVVQDRAAKVLWSSDGTEQGTVVVRRFEPGHSGSPELRGLLATGSRVFFVAEDDETGIELWTSDGTADGTHIVRDVNPGPADSSPGLAAFGERVVFLADDGVHGREPWTTDGTAAGTAMLRDISPGPSNSDPREFSDIGGMLVFAADDGDGRAPWVSDGTLNGTRRIHADIPLIVPGAPADFTRVGSRVFFAADHALKGNELWAFDLAALDACAGDCDGDGTVTIDEVITAVRLALDEAGACQAADRDQDGAVTIAELVAAVAAALSGCADAAPGGR